MILHLDVASPVPEFHLINENKVIQTIKIVQDINQKLSDNIIPVYLKISKNYNLDTNISKLIITTGPGSYTALRVGASFIAGLSQSMNLYVAEISNETIFDYLAYNNENTALYFESSNKQKFLLFKKEQKFIHEKIEDDKYSLTKFFSKIVYNNKPPEFVNKDILLEVFSIKQIVLKNLHQLDFKKNHTILPIYISNNTLLN